MKRTRLNDHRKGICRNNYFSFLCQFFMVIPSGTTITPNPFNLKQSQKVMFGSAKLF